MVEKQSRVYQDVNFQTLPVSVLFKQEGIPQILLPIIIAIIQCYTGNTIRKKYPVINCRPVC